LQGLVADGRIIFFIHGGYYSALRGLIEKEKVLFFILSIKKVAFNASNRT